MQQPISIKSTKAEILAAFEEMRQKHEESKQQQAPLAISQQKEEQQILQKTAAYTPSKLENDLVDLRKKIQGYLDELGLQLIQESKKLDEVRQAINIEVQRLKETRHIELAADS